MNFNSKLEHWRTGLDNAYELMLEAKEKEAIADEAARDWILTDFAVFNRLANKWLEDPTNREAFLDWGVLELKRERTPQYTRGWAKDPLGQVQT